MLQLCGGAAAPKEPRTRDDRTNPGTGFSFVCRALRGTLTPALPDADPREKVRVRVSPERTQQPVSRPGSAAYPDLRRWPQELAEARHQALGRAGLADEGPVAEAFRQDL